MQGARKPCAEGSLGLGPAIRHNVSQTQARLTCNWQQGSSPLALWGDAGSLFASTAHLQLGSVALQALLLHGCCSGLLRRLGQLLGVALLLQLGRQLSLQQAAIHHPCRLLGVLHAQAGWLCNRGWLSRLGHGLLSLLGRCRLAGWGRLCLRDWSRRCWAGLCGLS